MSELAKYEQQLEERRKAMHAYNIKYYTGMVLFMAGEYVFDVKIIKDYQLRITKDKLVLDFFPGSLKAVWLSNWSFAHLTRKHFRIKNVEKFLIEEFGGEEKIRPAQAALPETKTKREMLGECLCGGHFVKRYNKTNKSAFLGCSNYPRCKQTKNIFINKTN